MINYFCRILKTITLVLNFMDEYGLYIPIVGHPSAGKSTLIRMLTGKHIVVGKHSGTTKKITTIPISPHVAILDFPGFGIIKRRSKSKSMSDTTQQIIVDVLEDNNRKFLFGILVSDLSTIEIVSNKLNEKGIIPIDYEFAEYIANLSGRNTIVVGNKIDNLDTNLVNLDTLT